ncbi:DNA-binding HxlR family transcriptional regulator [Actinoalloteichus hymeniacidonis]|uniref:Transcriptional regulator, HxlR family n=2 Tax=Actinoalloteichus hymeniacidonis TaxID=340345 RepID=A0AAC9MZ73_9PSEU|nr:transcriptional regulator, HxlR family [Actinoalloteichus hymeniacidonis]MBB5908321.1 DNA-binding HxlR family transcriptional regulator [Actinoalloteichus hymeniacidonis]
MPDSPIAPAGVASPPMDEGPTDALVADVFARACTSRSALENVSGRWSILALLALAEGDYRFNALRRRVEGVSEKMLAQTLQALERDGLVRREVVTVIPARVEYSLTALGGTIAGRLHGLVELLEASVDQITEARTAYDERPR